jgi:EAL domain-containing protein (putative c-di-GMP-specific phosphodiesterase class I)
MMRARELLDALMLHHVFFHVMFLAFAVLVVHACQRLVEQATWHIEPAERRAGLPRAAFCLGCLVWALDVVGFLMYPWVRLEEARLVPALFALVLMILLARVLMPMFANTGGRTRALAASLGMALGVVAVHLGVASALGRQPVGIRGANLGMAIGLTFLISGGLAVAHRSRQSQGPASRGFRNMDWRLKTLAGFAVVLLHRVLDLAVPLEPRGSTGFGGLVPALLILVLFAVIVSLDQVLGLGAERQRREVFDRALALLRSASVPATGEQGRLLCMVAERVRAVLESPSFSMHFQPIVSLTGGPPRVRFEALMRASHPDLGAIHPELFFLACERLGLTSLADRAVIRASLRASLPWTTLGPRVAGVAVNVGPQTLLEPGFLPWLGQVLEELRLPRNWLELEITEHALVASSGPLQDVLAGLKALGVGTFLDDFGAGFSALGLLPQLPIRGIKCDRSLLQGTGAEPNRLVILGAICQLALALDMEATVEGIETLDDLERVRSCGAASGQGYFLARPMPAQEVPAWLASDAGLPGNARPEPGRAPAPLAST